MATHGVLIRNSVQAMNIDSLNRTANSASDIDNGFVCRLDSVSSTAGEGQVFVATAPATGSLSGLYMACSPEIVMTGNYKGLDPNPQNFYTVAGKTFDVFKVKVGDIVTVTADALTGTKSTNTYLNAADGSFKLTWGATQTASATSFKLLGATTITIGNTRVVAYQLECLAE